MRIDLVQSFLFYLYNIVMVAFGVIAIIVGVGIITLSIFIMLGKINLLHSYHRENVKEEDKKIFALLTGISISIGGIGILASGILDIIYLDKLPLLTYNLVMFIPLGISIILVLIFIKKYNGSIMG